MPRCANPECPDVDLSGLTMRHHWVQVHEIEMQQTGQTEMVGAVQHHFAALICSKRCAVAVLTAQLPAEDAEREKMNKLLVGSHGMPGCISHQGASATPSSHRHACLLAASVRPQQRPALRPTGQRRGRSTSRRRIWHARAARL